MQNTWSWQSWISLEINHPPKRILKTKTKCPMVPASWSSQQDSLRCDTTKNAQEISKFSKSLKCQTSPHQNLIEHPPDMLENVRSMKAPEWIRLNCWDAYTWPLGVSRVRSFESYCLQDGASVDWSWSLMSSQTWIWGIWRPVQPKLFITVTLFWAAFVLWRGDYCHRGVLLPCGGLLISKQWLEWVSQITYTWTEHYNIEQ